MRIYRVWIPDTRFARSGMTWGKEARSGMTWGERGAFRGDGGGANARPGITSDSALENSPLWPRVDFPLRPPEKKNVISNHSLIPADQGQIAMTGLSNQQTVERVAMVHGQTSKGEDVLQADR